jgi:hypothetical protein
VSIALRLEPDAWRRVAERDILERRHNPERIEVQGYDREHAPLATGQDVCRLAAIRAAGFDAVVRANRDIERLFLVAIEVAHEEAVAAVRILVPPLEGADHALASLPDRIEWQLCPAPGPRE